ncbi:MAG: hypothetical protein H6Q65_559 [Firmicutes bacterium]|nr:hypothetical protein [Bacillota bacterium]
MIFETVKVFSERVGLPEDLLRKMIRQGQIPHVRTGARHVRVHVEAGLEALKKYAEQSAEEIAARLPVPMKIVKSKQEADPARKKKGGRPPDSVRLAKKLALKEASMKEKE